MIAMSFPASSTSLSFQPNKPINIPHSSSSKSQSLSLSEQLQPLTQTLLTTEPKHQPQSQSPTPKPTWVNPSKPKPSVLSLSRHPRRPFSFNSDLSSISHLSRHLSSSPSSDELLRRLDAAFPSDQPPPSSDTALLLLNSLRPYHTALHFFHWLRSRSPLDTIFFNVLLKSLSRARRSDLAEKLAHQMIAEQVELDNVTYSTLITCLKKCREFDSAIAWFERMYRTGVVPDEVTYSAVLDVYAKLGKRLEVVSLYERARGGGWRPDNVAFSVLAKMFGEAGDYDGIQYVLKEMRELGVKPNVVVYNTLLEAMGKAGKPGIARSLFEEMVASGVSPNEKTLTAMVKVYGKARWSRDALELWERMRANKWPVDFILYNTLLSMCADLGLEDNAEELFADMKRRNGVRPDNWSYTAMISIYANGGKLDRAMEMFDEMLESNVQLSVMSCTCLVTCLAKARRVEDAVKVFNTSLVRGVKPDDRLCGCLLSVVARCDQLKKEMDLVLGCLEKANPRLVLFIRMLADKETSFARVKEELRGILNHASVEVRRPFCNCLVDICRNQGFPSQRADEVFSLGNLFGLYPGLHTKSQDEWLLNLRSLSVGAANTAFEQWLESLSKSVENDEPLPRSFSVHTGAGTHRFSSGLPVAFAAHLRELGVPFRRDEVRTGSFVADREDLISWVRSSVGRPTAIVA